MTNGPILIDLEGAPEAPGPDEAPAIGDEGLPQGTAMQSVLGVAARKPSRLGRWILGLALSFIGAVVSVAAWDFVTGLISRSPVLGMAVAVLGIALLLAVAIAVIRELAAFSRLARIDTLHKRAEEALSEDDIEKARAVTGGLMRLYAARSEMDWARARFEERQGEQFDASALMDLAEVELLASLDKAAQAEVQAAARQVAAVTAIVPLALADVAAALTSNLRMIRRVAEIYGGRSGTLGSWRLMRAVMTHLVATGAVAAGDDMLGTLAGGGLLSKLSRRFGEGVVNGALTARVGVAAMEVCRPVPFTRKRRPSVSALVSRALAGLFSKG
ncbi:YcjF family protein [Thalassovita mangrovi]|uniref:TIGR01620 family protein n=1 Tax=Thalassovita mangrovi TaxID=2692236 RepID=A0A6L8LGR8_9RHOB|nr:TIGR01620 family protein [Thalassovita mangrovi]MYM54913.1 TIGR01620 family protein [Thalassovita mangrovi]